MFGFAQTPAQTYAPPNPIPSKSRTFSIPFEVRPDLSADPVREIELLVSKDRGTRWSSRERLPVDAKKFDFQADADGEYWFSFRTITLSGSVRQTSAGPQIRVVVDAEPPVLTIDMKQQPSGAILVNWKAEDATIRGRRPDFAVSSRSTFDTAPNWRPLNVDGKHLRVADSGVEGGFMFWPENDAVEIDVRAVLVDFAGNRTEKTVSATIKPVKRDADTILRDAIAAENPGMGAPDAAVSRVELSGSFSPAVQGPPRVQGTALTPPKPVRMARKRTTPKPTAPEPKIEAEVADAESRPAPALLSPTGEPASEVATAPGPKANKEAEKPVDDLTRQLLANMDRFFDGQLSVEAKADAEKAKTPEQVVARKPANLTDGPSFPAAPQAMTAKIAERIASEHRELPPKTAETTSKTPPPGKITAVSLNVAAAQPQIIVKWNVGGAFWKDALIDVLRGESENGPWLPIATNLSNNGEYWYFLSQTDLQPFHLGVRIRGPQGRMLLDATGSMIRINPEMLGKK